MVVPVLLVLIFAALAVFGQTKGPSDLLLLALPACLAALILLWRAFRRRPEKQSRYATADGSSAPSWHAFRRKPQKPPVYAVIDGSNVLHWQDNQPNLSSLRAVIDHVASLGYTPGVVFDANAGYKISARYQQDYALARLLRLPADRVLVAPKGTPADPLILASARELGARIVTNDRYRDWAGDYPEVETPGHLVPGGFHDGKLWLELEPAQKD